MTRIVVMTVIFLSLALPAFAGDNTPWGQPINGFTTVVKIGNQEFEVSMTASPTNDLKDQPIEITDARGNKQVLAENFIGVVRFLNYTVRPVKGKLPKDLVAREEVSVVEQNYRIPCPPGKTIPVARGEFSDVMAMGVSRGPAFPDDTRQVLRQKLFLNEVEFVTFVVEIKPGTGEINIYK